jgi:hypothetical protein
MSGDDARPNEVGQTEEKQIDEATREEPNWPRLFFEAWHLDDIVAPLRRVPPESIPYDESSDSRHVIEEELRKINDTDLASAPPGVGAVAREIATIVKRMYLTCITLPDVAWYLSRTDLRGPGVRGLQALTAADAKSQALYPWARDTIEAGKTDAVDHSQRGDAPGLLDGEIADQQLTAPIVSDVSSERRDVNAPPGEPTSEGATSKAPIPGTVGRSLGAGNEETPGQIPEANVSCRTHFSGGQMVFFVDHVELCGVDICGGRRSETKLKALDALRQRQTDGNYVAFDGNDEVLSKVVF